MFAEEIRVNLRSLATNLIQQIRPTHPQLFVQKAVSLICALALREWPQRWPEFIDELLSQQNTPSVVCRVLDELSEEVHVFTTHIQNARRQDLRQALGFSLPQTLPYVTSVARTAHTNADTDTLLSALHCLQSFVLWADLKAVFDAGVPVACVGLLRETALRDEALRTLEALVSRPVPVTPVAEHHASPDYPGASFRDILFPQLLQLLTESRRMLYFAPFSSITPYAAFPALHEARAQPAHPDAIDADEHEFAVRFFSMLSQLGIQHFVSSYLFPRKGAPPTELTHEQAMCAAMFMDVMAAALATPSEAMRAGVQPFFSVVVSTMCKHTGDVQSKALPERVATLVDFISRLTTDVALIIMIRLPTDSASKAFADVDPDEGTSQNHFVTRINRASATVANIARIAPDMAVKMTLSRLQRLLNCAPARIGTRVIDDDRRFIVSDGKQYGWTFGEFDEGTVDAWKACVEGMCTAVDAIAGALKDGKVMGELESKMRSLCEMVFARSDEIFMLVKAQLLRAFHPIYAKDEQAMATCVKTLLDMASSGVGEAKEQRERALNSLSGIMRRLNVAKPQCIGRFSLPLCKYSQEANTNKGILTSHKILLMEAAFSCVMGLSNVNEQSKLAGTVIMPLLEVLSGDAVRNAFATPLGLLTMFCDGKRDEVDFIMNALMLVEAGMHQIVRTAKKGSETLKLPGILSRAVAPKAIEIACPLIVSLHSMFNCAKMGFMSNQAELMSMLHPTSRELAYLLNLDTLPHFPKHINDMSEFAEGSGASRGELASMEILKAKGVTPPDLRHARIRELLRNARRSAYELVRAAILSGATLSTVHVQGIVSAISTDIEMMEPLHFMLLVNRIIAPLMSMRVCGAGNDFLATCVNGLVRIVRSAREQVSAGQKGVEIFSSTAQMDMVRENSRRMFPKAAADFLLGMYPRLNAEQRESFLKNGPFIPAPLRVEGLASEILELWRVLCGGDGGFKSVEQGGAKVAFQAVSDAVDLSGKGLFEMFRHLCVCALAVGVSVASDMDGDVERSSVAALTSIIQKWPTESEKAMREAVGEERAEVCELISECVTKVVQMESVNGGGVGKEGSAGSTKMKKYRALVRHLFERIATREGIRVDSDKVVHALPEKLMIRAVRAGGKRGNRRSGQAMEEVELTDNALDSLFGEGEPL